MPTSREGIRVLDFQISCCEEIAAAQSADTEFKQLWQWIEEKRTPSTDELASQSCHLKCFAQLLSEMSLHDTVIILRRSDDPQRELIVVPSFLVERVIRFFHEGPGGAHQAAKANAAKNHQPVLLARPQARRAPLRRLLSDLREVSTPRA